MSVDKLDLEDTLLLYIITINGVIDDRHKTKSNRK